MPTPDAMLAAQLREFVDYLEAGERTGDRRVRNCTIDMSRYLRHTPHADSELVDNYVITFALPTDRNFAAKMISAAVRLKTLIANTPPNHPDNKQDTHA